MEMLTLRELCELLDISRRKIQGYEKVGLVRATGKNKYGHLLYDTSAKDRIEKIYFYQKLGFERKEIKEIIDASPDIVKKVLEKRIEELEKKKQGVEELIIKANQIIEEM